MMFSPPLHQYIDRSSQQIMTEHLIGDRSVSFLYTVLRERAPAMFRALTSAKMSDLLTLYHYDFLDKRRKSGPALFKQLGADWQECTEPASSYDTPRKVFERTIRYWKIRPMDDNPDSIVSPADSRVLPGSLTRTPDLFIKEKYFCLTELLGADSPWIDQFRGGDFAIFRLTPDKYHYNHLPVSGIITDFYEVDGQYHSCNPSALIALPTLLAKNKRVVTILDTNVPGGSGIGHVAMVEVVALMIGEIVQAYSEKGYENPVPLKKGMFVRKGCPKSLYRPGSSTDVLFFQPGTIRFSEDLLKNSTRQDVVSRFSTLSGQSLVETDVAVRSTIASRHNTAT